MISPGAPCSPLHISQIINECRNAEPSPGTAYGCPVMQLHPDRLGTHKLQNFGTFQESQIKIASLKDPTTHTLIVLFGFSRSVVVSVFVSINFMISAAGFKREHK